VIEFGLSNGVSFLSNPGPSWVDSEGFVYLADSGNETIVKFNQAGSLVAVFSPPVSGPLVAVATDSAAAMLRRLVYTTNPRRSFNARALTIRATLPRPSLTLTSLAQGDTGRVPDQATTVRRAVDV
jgi:hypothetical protein